MTPRASGPLTAFGSKSRPSPNHGPRRGGARPDMVVLHFTAMRSAGAALDRLCDPAAEVSAHYLICEAGTVWELVPEAARAWHAGAGAWGPVSDVNSRSIGIELAHLGEGPLPEPQMAALEVLLAGIMARHGIPRERVIGHSDMAPGRKSDPGPWFDWPRLARRGLAVLPAEDAAPKDASPGGFHAACSAFGYRWEPGQEAALLDAFRQRFRPFVTGPLGPRDAALAAALARDFPCRDA